MEHARRRLGVRMTDTPSTLSVEDRLALLETKLGVGINPLALVPPITIGELTDVPSPGSQLAAQWAQEVSSRVVQRFPTTAGLQAWAAPNGAYAVALDTGVIYRRVGGVWSQFSPWITTAVGIASSAVAPGSHIVNTANIPADPGYRTAMVSAFVRFATYYQYSSQLDLNINGGVVARAASGIVQPGSGSDLYIPQNVSWTIAYNMTPNVGATVQVIAHNISGTSGAIWNIEGNAYSNRIDIAVHPRAGY
jgi:hypothetical protein